MQRQRFDRVRENDLKKIFRNGKKLKLSKLLALSVVCGEKLNSPAGIGWSEIKNKKKNAKRKKPKRGERMEEETNRERLSEKKHIHFRVMFPVLTKWSAISGDRRKFNSVFILSREGRGNQGQVSC